ncbi:unnamed protein product, partial [Bubo scandiacus]
LSLHWPQTSFRSAQLRLQHNLQPSRKHCCAIETAPEERNASQRLMAHSAWRIQLGQEHLLCFSGGSYQHQWGSRW